MSAKLRLIARVAWLYLGLAGFGVSIALLIRARLGLDPWDVLHQGIARDLGVPIGWVVIGVSGIVLLAWIPLRQRPGFGTISNAIAVGLVADQALSVIAPPRAIAARLAMLAAAIAVNAVSTACYIGAGLGPGPRDGLMTGLAARGYSIRVVRTSIEVSVLVAGVLLGGSVGIGTVAYALSIGPLVHFLLPRLRLPTTWSDHDSATARREHPGQHRQRPDGTGTGS
ncbi:MAG TPA: hypothetical protein VMC83_42235 [Streptosporangiaceae bacterium]|nr:hypothetical protein [Streptosporangiaceae bacterium]